MDELRAKYKALSKEKEVINKRNKNLNIENREMIKELTKEYKVVIPEDCKLKLL